MQHPLRLRVIPSARFRPQSMHSWCLNGGANYGRQNLAIASRVNNDASMAPPAV